MHSFMVHSRRSTGLLGFRVWGLGFRVSATENFERQEISGKTSAEEAHISD